MHLGAIQVQIREVESQFRSSILSKFQFDILVDSNSFHTLEFRMSLPLSRRSP